MRGLGHAQLPKNGPVPWASSGSVTKMAISRSSLNREAVQTETPFDDLIRGFVLRRPSPDV
jgi:hypothetical protein